jgi:hypothetical protein
MLQDIHHFCGTDNYFKHWLGILYTDGVKYVAEEAKAYWLIDAIASHYPKTRHEEFQHWTFKKNPSKISQGWTLECTDGNSNTIAKQKISFSDFPIEEISFYLCGKVLMLPSEY